MDCSMPVSSILHYLMTTELCNHPFPPRSTFLEEFLLPSELLGFGRANMEKCLEAKKSRVRREVK